MSPSCLLDLVAPTILSLLLSRVDRLILLSHHSTASRDDCSTAEHSSLTNTLHSPLTRLVMSADRHLGSSSAGCSVTFHRLSIAIKAGPSSAAARLILSSASGHIRGGSFCALLGTSGAGKTTLLSCLAGHQHAGRTEGAVLVDGRAAAAGWYASHAAYVPQQSVLLPALTPRESISFASHMKLPQQTTEQQHTHNVDRIIAALNLARCADSQVGDEIVGGLSGGEKRRTNVAVELVNTPRLLLLDGDNTLHSQEQLAERCGARTTTVVALTALLLRVLLDCCICCDQSRPAGWTLTLHFPWLGVSSG